MSQRVLLLAPSNSRGGAEEHALAIAGALRRKGHRVTAGFPHLPATESLVRDYRKMGSKTINIRINKSQGAWLGKGAHLLHLAETLRCLALVRPDRIVLMLPHINALFGPMVAAGLSGIPSLAVFALVPSRWEMPSWRQKGYRFARNRHQKYLAVSENNRRLIAETFEMDESQISLIQSGPINQPFSGDPTREELLKELGLSETSKVALCVANFFEQKGHKYLIPALPAIFEEHPDWHVLFVGEGPIRRDIEQRLSAYGLRDRVHLTGRRNDIPRLLKACDLFLFPSLYEGQPRALLEAMASGIPIVSTNASGIGELLEDGEDAWLCPPEDSCELQRKLAMAIRDPEERKRRASNAQRRVANFSHEVELAKKVELIENLQ